MKFARIGLLLALGAACIAGVTAIIAEAAIPDATSGAFAACLNDNHSMRMIDPGSESCNGSETTVSWLGQGGAHFENHTLATQSITGGAFVASITVPPGRYLVVGKSNIMDTSSGANRVQCGLNGMTTNEHARATFIGGGVADVTVLGTVELTTTTNIELFCNPDYAADAEATVLTATSLSSIDAQ